jgi:hypothetical protein
LLSQQGQRRSVKPHATARGPGRRPSRPQPDDLRDVFRAFWGGSPGGIPAGLLMVRHLSHRQRRLYPADQGAGLVKRFGDEYLIVPDLDQRRCRQPAVPDQFFAVGKRHNVVCSAGRITDWRTRNRWRGRARGKRNKTDKFGAPVAKPWCVYALFLGVGRCDNEPTADFLGNHFQLEALLAQRTNLFNRHL